MISRGVAAAAFAGAIYLSSRRRPGPPPALIDWDRVKRLASAIGRRDRVEFDREAMQRRYGEMVARSQDVIAAYTGESTPFGTGNVFVFDRLEWLDANVASFRELFEPLEGLNGRLIGGASLGLQAFGDLNQMMLTGQMGVLLGYLSRRVLGQYDLALLGKEPVTTGRLYFVQPNIERLESRLGLSADEFRLWIALHETTHAYEFEAHPWLRGHMNGLLQRYFGALGDDIANLRADFGGLVGFVRRVGANAGRRGYAVELVMTDEQRTIFRQLQALMCLLEGYSNHVMDQVGRDLLPGYEQMKSRFESRLRKKSPAERLFAKLTGLDVKLEQYVLGERFVNEVVARAGVAGINRVWRGPDALPSLEEIKAPEHWLARVAA